jgi:AraC-like DNA-binding protein
MSTKERPTEILGREEFEERMKWVTQSSPVYLPRWISLIPGMKPEDRLLYGTVNGFVENGKICFIGNNELAKRVGCSVRTVQRYLNKQVSMGLLSVVKRTVEGKTQRTINTVKKDRGEIAALLGLSLDEKVEVITVPSELDMTDCHPPHDRLSP